MITKGNVQSITSAFMQYTRQFTSIDPDIQKALRLKEVHSYKVANEMKTLSRELLLPEEDICLAEIAGLVHDIGRFEQYTQYKTFMDMKSTDHASLGVAVLRATGLLNELEPYYQEMVFSAVECHNKATLPDNEIAEVLRLSAMLRDADKLDIWRIVTEYYLDPIGEKNAAIELDLPDSDEYSPEVIEDVLAQRIVRFKHCKWLNDFKLVQIGWVYDLNFTETLQKVCSRNYMGKIRYVLPSDELIDKGPNLRE